MSAVTRPRGPLPPRVYWTRRLLLVAVLTILVVLVARLLGGGADADDPDAAADEAARAAGEATSTDAPASDSAATSGASGADSGATEATTTAQAAPDGECAPEDVVVTPQVDAAVAGSPVGITLTLTTQESAACYWTVSAETTTVKVSFEGEDIWSTQQCPDALAETDLVVRKDAGVTTTLQWPAWRSSADCTNSEWSLPGTYAASAAPLAGEPTEVDFTLTAPSPEVIQRTVTPSATTTD